MNLRSPERIGIAALRRATWRRSFPARKLSSPSDRRRPASARLRIRPLLDPGLPQCAALADALEERPEWAGPAEPASVLHGDLWAGNVLWSDPPRLVDPACHTGQRETDLAMLALFGAAHLPDLLAAYDAEYPLAPGWQHRVGLHQIWPLLVHHRLFGGAYGQRAERIAAGYLRSG